VRRAAARSQCANNLKQIALGLHAYGDQQVKGQPADAAKPWLPAGTVFNSALPPERRLSWIVDVLPYVEQETLYRRIDRTLAWDDAANVAAVRTSLRLFRCPDWADNVSPNQDERTPYVGVAGLGANAATFPAGHRRAGVFGFDRHTALADITDGTANTLLILETARENGAWAAGGRATLRGLDPESRPHLGTGRPFGGTHFAEKSFFGRGGSIGCNAALADGSVRFLHETAAADVLEGAATIAGGEKLAGW
jgi:hypothetical protein